MLIDAGIDAGVGIAPVLPGLSDRPELLADVVRAARDAGATDVWCNVLDLQPGTREHVMSTWRATGRSWCRATWRSIAGRIPTAPRRSR